MFKNSNFDIFKQIIEQKFLIILKASDFIAIYIWGHITQPY